MGSIDPDTICKHVREGYRVHIVAFDESLKLKDANDAHWQEAIAYRRIGEEGMYVRSEADFMAKFEPEEKP